ncbi:FHA domain-containing protein [Nocardioides sp. LML1-1-1.1]|uniref:FHA domain-containing protein n=1 Tax=Nocardioides sp. LML1-1-1.1 TaxID=3135248 RepID=UPI003432BE20
MRATYVPGELATLVTPDGVVLAAADRLAEVAALTERGLEALTVVEVLSRGALTELPDFAVVRYDGSEVHVVVRGPLAVRAGTFALDGREAATWAEGSASLPAGATVEVAPLGAPAAGPALPIAGGVVRSAGVTWCPRPAAGAPAPPPAPVVPEPAPTPPPQEHTVVRVPQPAAAPVTAPPPPPPPVLAPLVPAGPPPSGPPPGWEPESPEHDGRTITPAQLQALRAGQAPASAVAPPAPPAPVVVALLLSTGRVVQVRRRVLIGRSPRVQQVGGSANLPALVTVDDPYVSSTHLEISSEGRKVTVTDVSTNGTLLARPGRTPVALDHGVRTELSIGDVLTLSKGLTVTVVPAQGADG